MTLDTNLLNLKLLSEIIVPLFSAFLGGFISIWIYRQGIREQKRVEEKKQIEENKEMEEYFRINILSILTFITFQVDEISKVCKKTKDWEAKNLALSIMPELKLTEIREIDFKYLFQILVLNKKGEIKKKSEDFINIKNSLHNIEDFISSQNKINQTLNEPLNRSIGLWNSSLKRLLEFNNKFVTTKLQNDKLMALIQDKVVFKQREILRNGLGNNLDIVFNQVVNPIIIEIPNFDKSDPRVTELLDILISNKQAYESLVYFRYERRKSLIFTGRQLLSTKRLLQSSMKSIENKNVKNSI
ncbi:hypothetical protein E6C50_03935 [Flavobacterium supellecticarium]|uniref:Uncharacterized protein n=1 Tax=Flavobacterium supellecticarium TaxID=2565924 RepID=A0A4S4A4H0_9FLAO|nr:hypothetical protein [Flavobacterium supellecticarium]THF53362.1 hypothetical protein E6C50_03935 [Flavobacterium supellecticarium]